jgi:hypothetical protein
MLLFFASIFFDYSAKFPQLGFIQDDEEFSMLKKGGVILLLLLFCAATGKGWYFCIDGFRPARVRCDLPAAKEIDSSSAEIQQALLQKYFYLGRGRQCYAFESADGRYVLKLPRGDAFRLPLWLRAGSFSFLDSIRESRLADKRKRFGFLMNSFILASQELKTQTGILYLHLASTHHLQSVISIHDRLGRSHQLNLDRAAFALQEKKELMIPLVIRCFNQGDRKGAQKLLEAFVELVSYRAKKGIFNKDPSFRRNFGYDGSTAVQIDIGSFYRPKDQEGSFAASFAQTMEPVDGWLGTVDPEMQIWFQQRVKQVMDQGAL